MEQNIAPLQHARKLLMDASFEPEAWSGFLTWLSNEIGADYAGIHFRLPEQPRQSVDHRFVRRMEGSRHQLLRSSLGVSDPLPNFIVPEAKAARLSSLLDLSREDHRRFRDEFLEPNGFRYSLLMRVQENSGVVARLSVSRTSKEFTDQDAMVMEATADDFRQSVRIYVNLARERFKNEIAGRAMQRLNFGWLSLGENCEVVEMSDFAQEFIRTHDIFTLTGAGLLSINPIDVERELRSCLRGFANNRAMQPRAIRIAGEPWVDLLVVPVSERFSGAPKAPVAVVYFHADETSTAGRHVQIAQLFGLLPSEARLALALSRGLSLSEAAVELGIAETTARSYSKRIYSKIGARGQVDLVRYILTSVLAIA